MAIVALSFNNKNQYRKYPLKQDASFRSATGYVVADDFIVNCSITSTYGKHRAYISQILKKGNNYRIAISSAIDDSLLGVFAGDVLEDFTTLNLTAFSRYVSGNITIGRASAIEIDRVLSFDADSAELEESVIFCYTPPAVSSIRDIKGAELRGNVVFGTLTNLTKATDNPAAKTKLAATNPSSIFNLADKSSLLGNCRTPVIKTINNVAPFPAGQEEPLNDGNIYIAGVKPIIFYGLPGEEDSFEEGALAIATENITLDSLCSQKYKLLPPVDVSGVTLATTEFIDKYYSRPEFETDTTPAAYPYTVPARYASNFNNTQKPEYYFWPQFVKEEYYQVWPLK